MFTEYVEAICKARKVHGPRIIDLIRQIRAVVRVDSYKAIEIVEKLLPGPIPRKALPVAQKYLAALKMRPDLFDGHASVVGGDVRELAEKVLTELAEWLQVHDARNLLRAYWQQTGIDPYQVGRDEIDAS